jgi:deazaflavin-dependent oxidoreductase (nitroreductase family)
MPITGEYEPSSWDWVRDQVAEYEATGGQSANTLMDTGIPIIVLTTRGNKSGKVRKMALMRVEHEGEYALVASQGGMPTNPSWYYNLIADPTALVLQDGAVPQDYVAREVTGEEKALWWDRSVAVYPSYADYQEATDRVIPVLIARRADQA